MSFTRKPDIQLALTAMLPRHNRLGWYSARQYLGTTEISNPNIVGGKRYCDIYIDVTELNSGYTPWRPMLYLEVGSNRRSYRVDEACNEEWEWRQLVQFAQSLVMNNWWSIVNKVPRTP